MYCVECGTELTEPNKFCANCGIAVSGDVNIELHSPTQSQSSQTPSHVILSPTYLSPAPELLQMPIDNATQTTLQVGYYEVLQEAKGEGFMLRSLEGKPDISITIGSFSVAEGHRCLLASLQISMSAARMGLAMSNLRDKLKIGAADVLHNIAQTSDKSIRASWIIMNLNTGQFSEVISSDFLDPIYKNPVAAAFGRPILAVAMMFGAFYGFMPASTKGMSHGWDGLGGAIMGVLAVIALTLPVVMVLHMIGIRAGVNPLPKKRREIFDWLGNLTKK